MIRSPVRELVKKEPSRFSKILISLYKTEMWEPTKKELFQLYEFSQDEDTTNFLQGLIKNPKSKDRVIAFETLLKHKRATNDW